MESSILDEHPPDGGDPVDPSRQLLDKFSLVDQFHSIWQQVVALARPSYRLVSEDSAEAGQQLLRQFGFDELLLLSRGEFGMVVACRMTAQAEEACKSRLAHVVSAQTLDQIKQSDGAQMALKLFLDVHQEGPVLQSYWQELEVISQLNHPHIIKMFYGFQAQVDYRSGQGHRFRVLTEPQIEAPGNDGRLFCALAMERLGLTLAEVQLMFNIERFTKKEIVLVLKQIGSALAYLHEKHYLLHNDLHPDNIVTGLRSNEGRYYTREDVFRFPLKLIDFGSARFKIREDYEASRHISSIALEKTQGEIKESRNSNGFLIESRSLGCMIRPGDDCPLNLRYIINGMIEAKICISDAVDWINTQPSCAA